MKSTSTSTMVALYGQASVSFRRGTAAVVTNKSRTRLRVNNNTMNNNNKNNIVIPDDPHLLLHRPDFDLNEQALRLSDWLSRREKVFCITGAGLSTDSGIPDYRGHHGSYHTHSHHKPIIHQQFMTSSRIRKRYWARSMMGWETFRTAKANKGHYAITELERMKQIGVYLEDKFDYYDPQQQDHEFLFTSGQRKVSVVTQNVDSLHEQAGSVIDNVLPIHGKNRVVQCVCCGHELDRNRYQDQLKEVNSEWFLFHQQYNNHNNNNNNEENESQRLSSSSSSLSNKLRPDGDAELLSNDTNYDEIVVPFCQRCGSSSSTTTTTIAGRGGGGRGEGFYKPDVVFFGDTVPKHRVALCHDAVQECDGILALGTSLTVHSVYRHVRAASTQYGVSTAIVNVGETRAELEGVENIVKIEAPVGDVLQRCVELLKQK